MIEALVAFVRKLHMSDSWTEVVNNCILERLNMISNSLSANENHSDILQFNIENLEQVIQMVWPALVLIGGKISQCY